MSDTQIPEKTEAETSEAVLRTTFSALAEEFSRLLELARAELDIRKLYKVKP